MATPLYEVQYKLNGTKYSFHFEKLKEKFHATDDEVNAAITVALMGVQVPTGPLKGLFIRPMSPSESEAIQIAYKRKAELDVKGFELNKLKLIIGSEDIW